MPGMGMRHAPGRGDIDGIHESRMNLIGETEDLDFVYGIHAVALRSTRNRQELAK